jgi:hypothetical protein
MKWKRGRVGIEGRGEMEKRDRRKGEKREKR